jgi:hypothetical protein
MVTWGVLRLPAGMDAAAGAGEGAVAAAVARHLDGLVAVAEDTPFGAVLGLLPATVTRVVELDPASATETASGALVARLIAEDDEDHAAVVAARPLADALKRIEGDVLVEGLVRDGLLTPGLPRVLDRGHLAAALAAAPGRGADGTEGADGDAVSLLLAAGHAIRVVPTDGEPITVRSRPTERGAGR